MRHPARLFATALLAAMVAVAVAALAVDLFGGRPDRHAEAGSTFVADLHLSLPAPMSPALSAPPASMSTGPSAAAGALADLMRGVAGATVPPALPSAAPATGPTAGPTSQPSRSATRAPARHDAAALSRSRAKQITRAHRRLAAARRKGIVPGEVTRSHYLRHLTGGPADLIRMRTLGARDAARNTGRQQHVVLLDIGGQLGNGVVLSTTPRSISYQALARAVRAYVRGYHYAQHRGAPVTVAIGTNNDLQTDGWTGRQWARQVVRPVRMAARHYRAITIAGATDIEPGFRAGPGRSRAWVSGFLDATKAPLIFNGSADGCSPAFPGSRCSHGWTAADLAWVAGVAAPHRISALPQVYNYTMADQWAMISLTAVSDGHKALRFHGPLTENAACRGEKACPTMGSLAAWRALRNSLRSVLGPVSLPARTDLDVH